MIIEYYATDDEDRRLFDILERCNIKVLEAFNPEDYYYVLETEDLRALTIIAVLGIEMYVTGEKNPPIEESDK